MARGYNIIGSFAQPELSTLAQSIDSDRLEDQTWFHGVLPKEEAENLLRHNGDFLVREEGRLSKCILSVYWDYDRHYVIEKEGSNRWRVEDSAVFPSITALINYLKSTGLPIKKGSRPCLKKAIIRKRWQLKNEDIKLQTKLGKGRFGDVWKAQYRSEIVAVKLCTERMTTEKIKAFVNEGMILKEYSHPNIVEFKGIAAQNHPIMIIMEYCPEGALSEYLKKHSLSRKQLVKMAYHAAKGMDYLERKGCIHRDLAARNCLVAEKMIVKISDFGMSRIEEEYVTSDSSKPTPYRWTAPEALKYGTYTSLSDVWSFGILMWEIFTECEKMPYPDVFDETQIAVDLKKGIRMEKPERAPTACYNLMKKCWRYKPEDRKDFQEIKDSLKEIYDSM